MADKVCVVEGAVKRGGDAMARGVATVLPHTHCMCCCRCPALIRVVIACYGLPLVHYVLRHLLVCVCVCVQVNALHPHSPLPSLQK